MAPSWATKRVLITVRTYPVPATKGIEVSCTAAVTDDGQWIRLFPVPYRSLSADKRFKKYQWIEVALNKAGNDPRPESYHLNIETIKLGETVSTADEWAARRKILNSLMRPSLCGIYAEQKANGQPTLGLFKPGDVKRLLITPTTDKWTNKQREILSQATLEFQATPKGELEKIPYDFQYEFTCSASGCRGHTLGCTDWEMGEAYRSWHASYGDKWEEKFREKFERDMIDNKDLHFFVGTLHQHPNNWMIIGLFYPPKPKPRPEPAAMRDLFG
jgi:hypothetical protein